MLTRRRNVFGLSLVAIAVAIVAAVLIVYLDDSSDGPSDTAASLASQDETDRPSDDGTAVEDPEPQGDDGAGTSPSVQDPEPPVDDGAGTSPSIQDSEPQGDGGAGSSPSIQDPEAQGDGGAGSSPSIQDPEPQGDGGVGSSPSSTEGDKSLETSLERILDSDVDLGRLGGVLPRDAIMPIYDPQFTPGKLASLEPGELVIGVEINGESKAYPVGPLVFREMVNDVVGGVPLLVTW